MAHLLNFPGDIKSNPVDASKMVVLRPTEKDIILPDIKMHVDEEMLIALYHMDSQVTFRDAFTDQNGGRCVKTTDTHQITIHNATTMEKLRTIDTGHIRSIKRILIWDGPKPNGPQIISCSNDGTLKVFDFDGRALRNMAKPEEGAKGRDKIGHIGKVTCMDVSKNEPYERTTVVSGGSDLTVRIWSLKSGKQEAVCRGHLQEITGVCFCVARNGTLLIASMDFSGEVRFWDRASGNLQRIMSAPGTAEKDQKYY